LRRVLRGVVALLVTALVLAAIGWASRAPWAPPADGAVLRLAWRFPGVRVEECRTPTAEELERLPIHMRRTEVCEGRMLSYRLRVRLDGREVLHQVVESPGARGDRPLSVLREIAVPPGEHTLEVMWEPADASAPAGARRLRASARLRLVERDVALVTYDPDLRDLVVVGYGVGEEAGAAEASPVILRTAMYIFLRTGSI
jgi:hypothetical protein